MGNIQFSEEIEYMNMKLDLKLLEHKLSRLTSMIIPIDNIQRNKHELSILNHIKENNNKLVMKFVNIKNNENKIINEVQDNLIKNELYFVTESNSFQIPNLTLSNIKSSESKKNNSPKNEIKMKEREEKKNEMKIENIYNLNYVDNNTNINDNKKNDVNIISPKEIIKEKTDILELEKVQKNKDIKSMDFIHYINDNFANKRKNNSDKNIFIKNQCLKNIFNENSIKDEIESENNMKNNEEDKKNSSNNSEEEEDTEKEDESQTLNLLVSQISPYKKDDQINIKKVEDKDQNISSKKPLKYKEEEQKIKKVTFDNDLIYIKYDQNDYVTNLKTTDEKGENLLYKNKDISKYFRLLSSEANTNKLKSNIYNQSKKNKKPTRIMKKNIDFIKEVETTHNLYNINRTTSKKKQRRPIKNCRRFEENPQLFFTENLCDTVLLSYNLDPKTHRSKSEIAKK